MVNYETAYTAEIADRILHELRGGRTLRTVCRDLGMPDERTVRRWVSDDREGFAARYTRAREVGYHAMADEIFETADDRSNDSIEHRKKNGDVEAKPNPVNATRAKLRLEARRWIPSKASPKIYGQRPDPNAGQLVRDTLAELLQSNRRPVAQSPEPARDSRPPPRRSRTMPMIHKAGHAARHSRLETPCHEPAKCIDD